MTVTIKCLLQAKNPSNCTMFYGFLKNTQEGVVSGLGRGWIRCLPGTVELLACCASGGSCKWIDKENNN